MPGAIKQSKNQYRRQQAKKKRAESATPRETPEPPVETSDADSVAISTTTQAPAPSVTTSEATTVDVAHDLLEPESSELEAGVELDESDSLYEQYKEIFAKFNEADKEDPSAKEPDKPEVFFDDDDDIPDEEQENGQPKLSKKARKRQNKLSIAELKALVKHPEMVEWTDADASDPKLLVALKSYRNVVPVPSHWSLKREYLSSKRGVEKPPFQLPKFIADTGIAEMRDAVLEKQDQQTLKQKQRERVQGKLGKLDIDYQKLYEAFFRFQTKPELTRYGEVYYEGKEYETNLRHLRPGELSDELKDALSIPPGAPPPWLINQQRFGPPPSYPALKIPGLNAPPPPGGQWGFHPGGYGKPPVDEYNRPLYGGDIFGVLQPQQNQSLGEPVEKTLWGELQPPEEESEEDEEDEEEEDEAEDDEQDAGKGVENMGIPSAAATEYGGTETVQTDFTMRKPTRGTETEESTHPRSAYTVLPEHNIRSQGFFGGERAYDLKGGQANERNLPVLGQDDRNSRKRKVGDVDVSVDMDALQRDDKLSSDEVKKQYETQRKEQGQWAGRLDQEDLSQMIADESRKRQKKDEERRKRR
ncbi:splicing factor 3B subunit 2 [Viridothelium virens]|uniref:Splicing factor 3B subunit 2 n=1 Tax=Viridothelium virens TaxID=1048519 RepID=A0A6A6H2G8_VIRVR|nr:splicing factor 3B subunit 2 [Viridothelium virens]